MWSFDAKNVLTGEQTLIFGFSWTDALRRSALDETQWICLSKTYED